MSTEVLYRVWNTPLPPSRKLILMVLADFADDRGQNACPAVSTIVKRSGYSEREVRYTLRSLEEENRIQLKGVSRLRTNVYSINLEMLSAEDERETCDCTPEFIDTSFPLGAGVVVVDDLYEEAALTPSPEDEALPPADEPDKGVYSTNGNSIPRQEMPRSGQDVPPQAHAMGATIAHDFKDLKDLKILNNLNNAQISKNSGGKPEMSTDASFHPSESTSAKNASVPACPKPSEKPTTQSPKESPPQKPKGAFAALDPDELYLAADTAIAAGYNYKGLDDLADWWNTVGKKSLASKGGFGNGSASEAAASSSPAPAPKSSDSTPSIPERRGRTAEEAREGARQALQRFYTRQNSSSFAVKQANLASFVPEVLLPLAEAFVENYGRGPLPKERSGWISAWKDQREMGLTAEDIQRAYKHMRECGLTIKTPFSVTAVAYDLKRREEEGAEAFGAKAARAVVMGGQRYG